MKLTKTQLEELSAFLGPAPVLTTENERHYNEFWEKLIECFQPQDLMELLLISLRSGRPFAAHANGA
jgi:hypothetical protein